MAILVNLFDENFRHSQCSVAGKRSANVVYTRDNMEWDGITIFTDAYIHDSLVDHVRSPMKIAWLHEPQCLWPSNYDIPEEVEDKFDIILTYYQPLLDKNPELYKFCPYGGIWIPSSEWGIPNKKHDISMLIGAKRTTEGHLMRHDIHDALVENNLDHLVDFYGVYGTPVDYGWKTKVKVLKDYEYSIITETCNERNLFTEILLDCFAVGTIPIMWGERENQSFITETFGVDSVLWFRDVDELIEILEWWPPSDCDSQQEALEAVGQFEITEDWIHNNYLVYL